MQVSYLPETNPYRLESQAPRAIVFIKDGTLVSQPEPGLLQPERERDRCDRTAAWRLAESIANIRRISLVGLVDPI